MVKSFLLTQLLHPLIKTSHQSRDSLIDHLNLPAAPPSRQFRLMLAQSRYHSPCKVGPGNQPVIGILSLVIIDRQPVFPAALYLGLHLIDAFDVGVGGVPWLDCPSEFP